MVQSFLISLANTAHVACAVLFEIDMAAREETADRPHRVSFIFPADDPHTPGYQTEHYTTYAARATARQLIAGGGVWAKDVDQALETINCAAGMCNHYTCTEGRSLDEWVEPEPTAWDYYSEGGFADPDPDYR